MPRRGQRSATFALPLPDPRILVGCVRLRDERGDMPPIASRLEVDAAELVADLPLHTLLHHEARQELAVTSTRKMAREPPPDPAQVQRRLRLRAELRAGAFQTHRHFGLHGELDLRASDHGQLT